MSLQKQISELQAENLILHTENEELKEKQKAFQEELTQEIERLRKLGPWKRFWGAWSLVLSLITTIEEGFKKTNS